MPIPNSLLPFITFTYLVVHVYFHVSTVEAQTYSNSSDTSTVPISVYYSQEGDTYFDLDDLEESSKGEVVQRRSLLLYWKKMEDYISYGALSENRVLCPPRSGRSYYTHDCFVARGPPHPYSRGCSSITRCRR
ncbi:hypothetical protein RND81_13G198700 [Saponaria officinalis]|uniref:Protein RALF-like 34 n=1 Tax=Saponaria officinalis TaxID=3572 RepID=A0AAW1H057_SAPOF